MFLRYAFDQPHGTKLPKHLGVTEPVFLTQPCVVLVGALAQP